MDKEGSLHFLGWEPLWQVVTQLLAREREKYIARGDDTWAGEVTDTDGKDESHAQSSRDWYGLKKEGRKAFRYR